MPAFSWTFRVRFHECDPQGIVFNANYFTYFDMTMTELFRASFPAAGYTEMVSEHGVDVVVAEATARFAGSARFDDEIELRAAITRLGTTGMTTDARRRARRRRPRVRPSCGTSSSTRPPGRRPRSPTPSAPRSPSGRRRRPERAA